MFVQVLQLPTLMFMSYADGRVCGVVLEYCVVGVTLEVLFGKGIMILAAGLGGVTWLVVCGCAVGAIAQ